MDFVVVGILVGASMVGAGAVVRDLLPRQRPLLTRRSAPSIEPEALHKAWNRFCQSAGMVIMTMGLIVVFCTVLAIVLSFSDRAGWILIGASTTLAAVVFVVSAVTIPNHYRRGGFDPVYRVRERAVRAPVVTHDIVRKLGASRPLAADDLFAETRPPVSADDQEFGGPAGSGSELVTTETENWVSGNVAPNGEPDNSLDISGTPGTLSPQHVSADPDIGRDRLPVESAPESARVAFARSQPQPDAGPVPAPEGFQELARPTGQHAMRAWNSGIEDTSEPTVVLSGEEGSGLAAHILPVLEPPLIDPEDELPAWNAPPRSTPPPPAYIPPVSPSAPGLDAGDAFESSLFADLEMSTEDANDIAGPFQSRLLNELTGEDAVPSEERADVLIDEFSLPAPDRPPGTPDATNNSR